MDVDSPSSFGTSFRVNCKHSRLARNRAQGRRGGGAAGRRDGGAAGCGARGARRENLGPIVLPLPAYRCVRASEKTLRQYFSSPTSLPMREWAFLRYMPDLTMINSSYLRWAHTSCTGMIIARWLLLKYKYYIAANVLLSHVVDRQCKEKPRGMRF